MSRLDEHYTKIDSLKKTLLRVEHEILALRWQPSLATPIAVDLLKRYQTY